MCETRDLGFKWPYWHTLVFSDEIKIDMRYVRPRDGKKMLVQRARSVFWKKWAATHEQEELKEGAWIDPALVLLRKKAKGLFDIGWSDTSHACQMEEGTVKHRLCHCPVRHAVRRDIPESFRKWERKAETSKKEWMWQRGIVARPLSECQWNRGHYSVTKWKSEKHRSWCMPVEGFEGHVGTEGSLLGKTGKWRACGWAMVQLDCDAEMGALCTGCMAQWRQSSRSSAPSRGRS